MFNPFRFIDKIKQALIARLISFMSVANQHAPMIKQREFLHQIDVKKLRASNDSASNVIEPFR